MIIRVDVRVDFDCNELRCDKHTQEDWRNIVVLSCLFPSLDFDLAGNFALSKTCIFLSLCTEKDDKAT